MGDSQKSIDVRPIQLEDLALSLSKTQVFASTPLRDIVGIDRVARIAAKAGTVLVGAGEPWRYYWLLLEGEARAERSEADDSHTLIGVAHAGETFGEVHLLTGRTTSMFRVSTTQDSIFVRFTEQDFWSLLACCPSIRRTVLANGAQHLHACQFDTLHREKLISLGTLAAGLMHELNNPAAAAKRAASQLRENLRRLQQLSLLNAEKQKTPAQLDCLKDLLEHGLRGCNPPSMSSIEQADAEEALSEWLAKAKVDNAFSLGPVFVSIGIEQRDFTHAQALFDSESFSIVLNWFGALVSSVSLVCAIEESISRVSELVMAVKKFVYDDRVPDKDLDIHDSLQSTLTILGHKFRIKQIQIEKRFAASPSIIRTRGSAIGQVWTNLIDNAVDASPEGGKIEVSTWSEPEWLVVSVGDHGPGIPSEVLPRIFEPFFTTKPEGAGMGLGLEIVHRIVTQKFGGKIDVDSKPGDTHFVVRLPLNAANAASQSRTTN
jgi:signal transduction histidine kinase